MPLQATSGAASYDAFGGGVAAVPQYIEDVFGNFLYTGNGFYPSGGGQTIVNGIDLAGNGGLIWIKARSTDTSHGLYDTARGINQMLGSNNTSQQYTDNAMVSANSNGFTLGSESSGWTRINLNGQTYASWTFRKQPKFFDVVTYTGNGVSGRAIPHNLGSAPGFIAVKILSSSDNWECYHRGVPFNSANVLWLNSSNALTTGGSRFTSQPTSTDFYVSSDSGVNGSGQTYVAYLFAHNAGGFGLTGTDNVISCGSYTGNGSSSGPTITLGYEPQWVMVKRTDSTSNWFMLDIMRGIPNTPGVAAGSAYLFANTSAAEDSAFAPFAALSATGFSLLTSNSNLNASGGSYIYIAIRRGPMKVPTSGTSVFAPVLGRTANPNYLSGFPVDFAMSEYRVSGSNSTGSRLQGSNQMDTASTGAEASDGSLTWDFMNGYYIGGRTTDFVSWMWRRAPSVCDVVCYTGTGVNGRAISHNLGVAPELAIVKSRNNPDQWWVFSSAFAQPADNYFILNGTLAVLTATGYGFTTTSTTFTPSPVDALTANASGFTYVAYLFATCAGVSKVFSFTGSGSLQTINCGFTSGARFVLVKRTDSTGDWYVWDSARGISSSTDPYLLLNSTAAEVTSTNWVDTTSTGFQVTAASGNNVNINGATYIGLAIA